MRATPVQTRWRALVPLVVIGGLALGTALAVTAGATGAPPYRTAAQLVADLDRVSVPGYAGTVVQKSTLLSTASTSGDGLSLSRLMAGTNTIRVWSGGPDRQRIAVLDATGETDLYRDGPQIWQWNSNTREAVQSVATTVDTVQDVPIPVDGTTVTPDDLARQAVAAIGPSTTVTVGPPSSVAGRPVYELELTPPAASDTRIGRVVISLDGETRMPLAAQVFSRGLSDEPAIDLSFTHIAFEVPGDEAFRFTPPPGVQPKTYNTVDAVLSSSPDPLLGLLSTRTTGEGWTRVAIITPPNASARSQAATVAQFGRATTAVSGSWGSGRLLQTNGGLLSMLFVDDGRIAVGSVDPDALYAALG